MGLLEIWFALCAKAHISESRYGAPDWWWSGQKWATRPRRTIQRNVHGCQKEPLVLRHSLSETHALLVAFEQKFGAFALRTQLGKPKPIS